MVSKTEEVGELRVLVYQNLFPIPPKKQGSNQGHFSTK